MESLWTWLSTPPGKDDVLDLFGVFCLLLLVPGFVGSAYLAGAGADRLAKDPVQLAGLRHWASIGLWLFGAGLFFLGVRLLQINPLSFGQPIWLLGSLVVIFFSVARCVDWWRTVYPAELARRAPVDTIVPLADRRSRVGSVPSGRTNPEVTVRK